MHQQVKDAFPGFTQPLEGCVLWPYLDILGLVTVGYGCLIDPVSMAEQVKWEGAPTGTAVRGDFAALKARKDLARLHYNYAKPITSLRLTQAGADALLNERAGLFEVTLRKHFPNWVAWPADAQLAAMAMAWAVGAGFPAIFKNFTAFANKGDWTNAAKCAAIKSDGNPGIVPRNAAVQVCLASAAIVTERMLPIETLFWPGSPPPHDIAGWRRGEPPMEPNV